MQVFHEHGVRPAAGPVGAPPGRTRSAATRRSVTRRGVLAAGLGAAALGLVGCSGRSETLRATWWGDPGLTAAVRSAIAGFERDRGVPIDSEFLPWDGYWDKLATQAAGRSEPDVIMQAGTYLPEYVPRHALLDLSGMTGGPGDPIDLSGLDAGVRDAGDYRGGTYAVIAAVNSSSVLYNLPVLRRAGQEPPRDDWTWEDLVRIAGRVAKTLGDGGYGVTDAGGDLIAFQVWTRQRGQELFDASGELAIAESDLAEWLSFWKRLRDRGLAPPAAVTVESANDPTRSPLVRGTAAFMVGWNQDLIANAALTKDELDLVMLPGRDGGEHGQWLNAASMWAVSAHTERPRLAAELVDHLLNDERAIDALRVWLGVPPLARARERIRPGLDATGRKSLDYIERVRRRSRPLPRLWPRGFTELRDLLPRLNEDVGFGKRSVREAAERFFVEAGRALA